MQKNIPKHVAIIPDANRRWAVARGLPAIEGHREGYQRMKDVLEEARDQGIEYMTFWAGSEDNLKKRSRFEVRFLATLLKNGIVEDLLTKDFFKWESRVRILGKWDEILRDKTLRDLVHKIENRTKKFTKRNLTILFGYNGTTEMTEAIKDIRKTKESVTYDTVKKHLWTHDLPEVDLVIRTGGEPHWSVGFMMWLTANSQLYFTRTKWPDFGKSHFKKALKEYSGRGRRLGK